MAQYLMVLLPRFPPSCFLAHTVPNRDIIDKHLIFWSFFMQIICENWTYWSSFDRYSAVFCHRALEKFRLDLLRCTRSSLPQVNQLEEAVISTVLLRSEWEEKLGKTGC
jgi:hypothetical protein